MEVAIGCHEAAYQLKETLKDAVARAGSPNEPRITQIDPELIIREST